jgi:heparosan-N-sulfate-glucuronate 5-epimerase
MIRTQLCWRRAVSLVLPLAPLLALSCCLELGLNADYSPFPYTSLTDPPTSYRNDPLFVFDSDGVIQVRYPDLGTHYNPAAIAQYSLSLFEDWQRNGTQESKAEFLLQVRYLVAHYVAVNSEMIGYPYDFDYAHYGMVAPWYSAMANGQIVSVLIRYYFISHDQSVLTICRRALRFMIQHESDSPRGLTAVSPEGRPWFEEYPSAMPSLVLNGFIFALIGLKEFAQLVPGDSAMRTELEEATASLKYCLPAYDTGSWTYYDRYEPRTLATDAYMQLHSDLMRHLYELTRDQFFFDTWVRWQTYQR